MCDRSGGQAVPAEDPHNPFPQADSGLGSAVETRTAGRKRHLARIRETYCVNKKVQFFQFARDLMAVPKASRSACSARDPSARVTSGPRAMANRAMNIVFSGHFHSPSFSGLTALKLSSVALAVPLL